MRLTTTKATPAATTTLRDLISAEAFVCRQRHPLEWRTPAERGGPCEECVEIVQVVARAWEQYREVTGPMETRR